ncbi:Plant specific eukaryotic initiation factor 4B protein [Dioscorea alata]|uniref:Plant specific eukaryotic initiation factor 4B protein n=1 Tax=Dioscorea alata TaxID=55571 RepID=A0ACB7V084_DIOAL|nr:Plant specific eukaryotic initiation factor 4B protein [Dioscorea alata]
MEFSWADEVEREEEEAKVKRKANPFGDARPREVVLEEKGVDWRKLDRERDLHSILREDERTSMVNAHIRTMSINEREQFPLAQRCEIKNTKHVSHANAKSCVQLEPPSTFVPPLKYPPKNIATLMQQIRKMDHNSKSNEYKPRNRYASKYPIPGQNARDAKKMVLESKDMVRGQRRVVLVDLNQHNNTEASRDTFDTFVMDHRRKNFKCVSHSTSSVADTCDTFGSVIHSTTSLADKVVRDSETMCNKKRGIHSASSVSVPRKRREGKHARR